MLFQTSQFVFFSYLLILFWSGSKATFFNKYYYGQRSELKEEFLRQRATKCKVRDFPVQPNFDLERFLGNWFEVTFHFKFTNIEVPNDSFTTIFRRTKDPLEIQIVNGFLRLEPSEDSEDLELGFRFNGSCGTSTARNLVTTVPGRFFTIPAQQDRFRIRQILYTDYDNVALIYECTFVRILDGTCSNPRMKLVARKPFFDDKYIPLVTKFAERVCLKFEDFEETVQDIDCKPKELPKLRR